MLQYYGGKSYILGHLLKLIPPHTTYVEVFGGGATLLIAKSPSTVEVYNDIDNIVVTFFRVLRDEQKVKELQRRLFFTPYSRAEFEYCKRQISSEGDEIEIARCFFVLTNQSFMGHGQTWSPRITSTSYKSWANKIDSLLLQVAERFRRVIIENKHFRNILTNYDTPNTFFYLDPPYLPETRKSKNIYRYEMNREEHEELIDLLLKIKGKVLLSGYPNELYDNLLNHGWVKCKIPNVRTGSTKGGINRRTECLWANYDINSMLQNEHKTVNIQKGDG